MAGATWDNGGGDHDANAAANYGGTDPAGNALIFDDTTADYAQFSDTISVESIAATADYTGAGDDDGKLDFNNKAISLTSDLTLANKTFLGGTGAVSVGGDVLATCANYQPETGTWTVAGDYDVADITDGHAGPNLRLTGSGKTLSAASTSNSLRSLTIVAGASITSDQTCWLYANGGGLALEANATLTLTGRMVANNVPVTLAAGATLDGADTLTVRNSSTGDGITSLDATAEITCDRLQLRAWTADATLAPGAYAPSGDMVADAFDGETCVVQLSEGTYTINSHFKLETSDTGATTLDGLTNDATLNLTNHVSVDASGGDINWTGTANLTGAGNQNLDIGDLANTIDGVSINKTGGTVTLTSGINVDSLSLSAGELDPNGQSITAGTIGAVDEFSIVDGDEAMTGVVVLCDFLRVIGDAENPLNLRGDGGWTLTVNEPTPTIENAIISGCDASGGEEIVAINCTDAGHNTNIDFGTTSPSDATVPMGAGLGLGFD